MSRSLASSLELPVEDPKDPFDRQRFMDHFDHSLISSQSVLVLGVGSLGCSVALALARLGVEKIVLVDYDQVEMSNLNRQVLFSRSHVEEGLSKVEAARRGLQPHLVGETKVEGHNLDVSREWPRVVELARESDVIFNNIDIGLYFDYALLKLATALSTPYVAGSSYARNLIVEFFTGSASHSSFTLDNPDGEAEIFDQLRLETIATLPNLSFVPHDDVPLSRKIGSNVLVATTAGMMTVNMWLQTLMGFSTSIPNYFKMDLAHFSPSDIIAWPHPERSFAPTVPSPSPSPSPPAPAPAPSSTPPSPVLSPAATPVVPAVPENPPSPSASSLPLAPSRSPPLSTPSTESDLASAPLSGAVSSPPPSTSVVSSL